MSTRLVWVYVWLGKRGPCCTHALSSSTYVIWLCRRVGSPLPQRLFSLPVCGLGAALSAVAESGSGFQGSLAIGSSYKY